MYSVNLMEISSSMPSKIYKTLLWIYPAITMIFCDIFFVNPLIMLLEIYAAVSLRMSSVMPLKLASNRFFFRNFIDNLFLNFSGKYFSGFFPRISIMQIFLNFFGNSFEVSVKNVLGAIPLVNLWRVPEQFLQEFLRHCRWKTIWKFL